MQKSISLIPQHKLIIIFISSWAAKCCPEICHVRLFTYLSVANPKTIKSVTDMAKIAIKSEKITPFGGNKHNGFQVLGTV